MNDESVYTVYRDVAAYRLGLARARAASYPPRSTEEWELWFSEVARAIAEEVPGRAESLWRLARAPPPGDAYASALAYRRCVEAALTKGRTWGGWLVSALTREWAAWLEAELGEGGYAQFIPRCVWALARSGSSWSAEERARLLVMLEENRPRPAPGPGWGSALELRKWAERAARGYPWDQACGRAN